MNVFIVLLAVAISIVNSISHEEIRRSKLVRIAYNRVDPDEVHPPRGILFSWYDYLINEKC